jgi:hypothetical protein
MYQENTIMLNFFSTEQRKLDQRKIKIQKNNSAMKYP